MTTETTSLQAEELGHATRVAVIKDKSFMAGVMEALEEESRGASGKTLEEIRKEYGLTH